MKIKRLNTFKVMLAVMLAFFIFGGCGMRVYAAEPTGNAFENQRNEFEYQENVVEYQRNAVENRGNAFETMIGTHIFHDGDTDSSGVTELDDSLTRGKTFLVGIIHFFGAAVALFGVVFAAIGFLGRDNEQKIIGITAFIVGIAIFFAPQIVNAVVGQSVF